MKQNKFLFWQPHHDLLRLLVSYPWGNSFLIILNYLIWPFLAFISFVLVHHSANIFWQLFIATLVGEIIERYVKSRVFWPRPMTLRHDRLPTGLVPAWYNTGSFPSGHTIKAVFFFFFIIQYQIFSPVIYLTIVIPLLLFRVLIGFHYPIDILGGSIIGFVTWGVASVVIFPTPLVELVRVIFSIIPIF